MVALTAAANFPEAPSHLRVQCPITTEVLLQDYWNLDPALCNLLETTTKYERYRAQYVQKCLQLSQNRLGSLKHQDVINALSLLLSNLSKADILIQMRKSRSNSLSIDKDKADTLVEELINFTAQALLLVDARRWPAGKSFESYMIEDKFSPSTDRSKTRLSRHIHVRALRNLCGLKVRWTDLLDQHLLLDEDHKKLYIFKHIEVLNLLRSKGLIDDMFIKETRVTYCQLLPYLNHDVAEWFGKQRNEHNLSDALMPIVSISGDERQLNAFSVWKDRMTILKEYYDEHEPSGLRQNFSDQRNPSRKWAFGVAIMVFILTVAQVIGTILQVYKPFNHSST